MAVVDAEITTTTATAFIPTLWSDGVVQAAEFGANIQKRVNRTYEKDLPFGNTLNIPRQSNLTTQSKSAGITNTVNFEAITEGTQAVTVSTDEYAAFLVDGLVEIQANEDLRSRYETKIGYAITRGREVNLAGLFPNFTSSIVGTYGVELTADDYATAWQDLALAGLLEDSPDPGEDFSTFLSPAAYTAATKIDIFANRLYNPDADVVQKMHIGDIYGTPVYLSNLLNAPGASQHANMMMHRDAVILIVQEEVTMMSQFQIRYRADAVLGFNVYGFTRVSYPPETPGGGTAVDNRGVLLKSI